jgi:long-chain acyl-CoA synthetase
MTSMPAWWGLEAALARFLTGLVETELARLRPGRPVPVVTAHHDLVQDLGADSLELMALTAAIAEVLQLPQAGLLDPLLADTRLAHWTNMIAGALDQLRPETLVFRTSGSAGPPKPCVQLLASLWQEVSALAVLLPARTRIVSAVPAHHIYGFLFTVLLPAALGQRGEESAALPVIDVRSRVAAGVLQDTRTGDLVIGHPAWWQAALPGASRMAADVTGVTSTAPCPDALALDLAAAGLARLLQVYGSSETAGVGWRDAPAAPYTLLPYWHRAETVDAAAEAEQEQEQAPALIRTMADGSLSRYLLQDRLAWQDSTRFVPSGRRDDAVQVGGVNVYPARVAEVLRQHPGVRDAAVRLMRPDEGSRLKAFVVGEGEHLVPLLEAWAAGRLAVAERPASFTVGAALPRQRSGKLADWIIEPADDGPPAAKLPMS